ncbi:sigma-70 family RNA polymerase sigma factor [Dielma fastidiosa]|uniref:Sigma-70 family RNA polymerase sigma factor n=1 Tax=Dielma fastidiosa TaxID=1034346 RepID=A0AB35UT61_9FIRM|nr:sigma-70 family RNA polymerase sigma factor [Dielma fastidiosa]MDY5168295.1 sigma-70 family RNA polymerase sigma factor [Dielma fastidiosa]
MFAIRDSGWIEKIIEDYGDYVFRLCYMYMKNRSDAEDIYQETFLKLYDCGKTFNDEKHCKAWLLKVAANKCRNALRFSLFHAHVELDEQLSAPPQTDSDHGLMAYVLKLPAKYRDVIYLYYYEEYPTLKIAELLKTSDAAVRTRLKRGREMLRNEVSFDEE